MNADAQVLRDFFAAINRHDMDAMAAHFAPDVVRVEPPGWPTAGTYRGVDAVRAHVGAGRRTWAEGSCDPERYLANGDRFVVHLHARVRMAGSDDWVGGRFADGFVVRDGRIHEYHTFWERHDALAWAGITDEAAAEVACG